MEKTSSKVALFTALVLLTGAVIIEGILIFWMQQEINYIKTTINREDPMTVINTDKPNVESLTTGIHYTLLLSISIV